MGDSSPPSSSSMLSTMARIFVLVAMLFLNIPTVVVATDKEATALIDKLNVALNSTQVYNRFVGYIFMNLMLMYSKM